MDERGRSRLHPVAKLALELGPLVLFFFANAYSDRFGIAPDRRIFVATGLFVAATVVALAIHFVLVRRLPIMLNDDFFIKIKPTIVNTLFGTVLLAGLWWRKSFLAVVLDSMVQLTEEGWRKLTLRWGLFFFVLAILNEVVWRTQSTDIWVNFKVFGIMPLTLVFALAQTPLLSRYELKTPERA